MAVTVANLVLLCGAGPGRNVYRYDTLDSLATVETAGYFNNVDDDLNLAKGDLITVVDWTTAIGGTTGIVAEVSDMIVTNVIARDAAASAGAVDIAEWGGGKGGGALSSAL